MTLKQIISGAQTGADRAALDWAIFRDIPHGGGSNRKGSDVSLSSVGNSSFKMSLVASGA